MPNPAERIDKAMRHNWAIIRAPQDHAERQRWTRWAKACADQEGRTPCPDATATEPQPPANHAA